MFYRFLFINETFCIMKIRGDAFHMVSFSISLSVRQSGVGTTISGSRFIPIYYLYGDFFIVIY